MASLRSVVSTLVTGAVLVVGGGVAYSAVTAGPGSDRATVVRVIDGDTIEVKYDGAERTVRLLNVDAPETKFPGKAVECLGPEADQYLRDQLLPGDTVRLEFDQERHDRDDRELAGVFEADVLINAEIARRGLGIPVLFEPNRKFLDEVTAAYEEAKVAEVGMFSPTLACTFEARIDAYEATVTEVEASIASATDVQAAEESAATVVSEGAVLLALIAASDAGTLEAAGLTAAELDALSARVVGLQERATTAAADLAAQVEAEKKAEEARKKAEAEKKKAEEKAKEEAERKAAEEEAERKAEEQAQREAEEAAAAEAARVAAEEEARRQQQSQIQPLMPQQPAPQPPPAPEPPPSNVYYKNCDAARAAGAAPVYFGQPGYGTHLDRDRDGIGCE